MFKNMREKSTRYLGGELVAWLIATLGLLLIFFGSYGFTSIDMASDTALAVRNSSWAIGSILVLLAILYGYLNWSTERSKNKVTHFSFRFFGFLTLFIIFGYQLILITSQTFMNEVTLNTSWLVLNSIIAAVIVIFGIFHLSSNVQVKEVDKDSRRKEKKEKKQDKKKKVTKETTSEKKYSDDDLKNILKVLSQNQPEQKTKPQENKPDTEDLKLW